MSRSEIHSFAFQENRTEQRYLALNANLTLDHEIIQSFFFSKPKLSQGFSSLNHFNHQSEALTITNQRHYSRQCEALATNIHRSLSLKAKLQQLPPTKLPRQREALAINIHPVFKIKSHPNWTHFSCSFPSKQKNEHNFRVHFHRKTNLNTLSNPITFPKKT